MIMYILYQTTNLINGKIYVGMHQTDDIDDGYLGSGAILKQAIKKYGKENFKFEILQQVNNIDELNTLEREIVNKDFVKRRDTYNMEIGGRGGKVWTDEMKSQMSKSVKYGYENGRTPWNKGKKTPCYISDEKLKEMSDNFKGEKNPMYGKDVADFMTEEDNKKRLERISRTNKGKKRTQEHKKNYSKAASQRIWLVHRSGKISHTTNKLDERLNHPDWQRGQKWKDNF